MHRLLTEVDILERFYIKLYNIYALVSQMFFFVSCALVFEDLNKDEKQEEFLLIALKSVLFYSIVAYFVTKSRDILSSHRSSPFRNWNMTEGLCRILLEWIKAIIVVICLREQGISFKPNVSYIFLTFTYYLCTEKIFTEIFVKIFQYLAFEIFEDLENLFIPLLLNLYTISLSFIIQLCVLLTTKFITFTFLCSYFTIYIRSKDAYYNYWRIIETARQTLENLRYATQKELDEYDDICAVCLNKMSKAKITPCNHYFHPNCIKECLKNSLFCPLCKFNF